MHAETLDSQVQPATDRSGSIEVIIVADDLTGACDSGVAFLASGLPVRATLHGATADANPDRRQASSSGVLSCTTETRNLTQAQAAACVSRTVAALIRAHPNAIVFKKVDSAARGNFGAETLAALEASGAQIALVAPAFPHAERTVHSGILSVRDCSGQDSRISLRDQFPTLNSSQIDILRTDSEITNLRLFIRQAIANGTRILLCDTDTQEDLEHLASTGRHLAKPLLWAGSAGLAQALAATLSASAPQPAYPHIRLRGRTLLFAGSPHPVTHLQLSRLEDQAPELKDSVIRLLSDSPSKAEIQLPFSSEPVAALILTGGDTAASVLAALNASSIRLAGEISPGIPWGFVEGGAANGCLVITKSGGFGDRDTLLNAFDFCRPRPA